MEKKTAICLFPNERIRKIEGFRQKYINHPSKDVPFHITLLTNFFESNQFTQEINQKIYDVARKTKPFSFEAVPISTFPTTNVIYLNPVPVSNVEALSINLRKEFPAFFSSHQLPVFHMTIAYQYKDNMEEYIISKYLDKFGSDSIQLTAGRLGICIQEESGWKEILSYKIGENNG